MKKQILYIIPLLFCIGCHTQKKVAITESTTAYHSMNRMDSLRIEYKDSLVEVSLPNYKELTDNTYTQMLGGGEEWWRLHFSVRETQQSLDRFFVEWEKNGTLKEKLNELVQSFTYKHRREYKEKERLRIHITYLIPLEDVSQKKVIKVAIENFSPDFNEEEGKALFEFAEKMQFEFEYRPYKNYTTGNVVMKKLLRIRKLKK